MANSLSLNDESRLTPSRTGMIQGWLALYFLLPTEEFENLHLCLHDSVDLVAQRQKAFDERVDKAAEGLDDEERSFYYDHYSEEHERLHRKFPQLVSASTLLMRLLSVRKYVN